MKSAIPSIIDTVEVIDITVHLVGPKESVLPGAQLQAKYNLVASSTGMRLGQATASIEWSEETQKRLRSFMESIESDLCERVFGLAPSIDGGGATDDHNGDGVQGL